MCTYWLIQELCVQLVIFFLLIFTLSHFIVCPIIILAKSYLNSVLFVASRVEMLRSRCALERLPISPLFFFYESNENGAYIPVSKESKSIFNCMTGISNYVYTEGP